MSRSKAVNDKRDTLEAVQSGYREGELSVALFLTSLPQSLALEDSTYYQWQGKKINLSVYMREPMGACATQDQMLNTGTAQWVIKTSPLTTIEPQGNPSSHFLASCLNSKITCWLSCYYRKETRFI